MTEQRRSHRVPFDCLVEYNLEDPDLVNRDFEALFYDHNK